MQNLLENIPDEWPEEWFDVLLKNPRLRIERIVSRGHATPEGDWYDQDWDEWVLLVQGSAGLRIENCADISVMKAGDHLYLPAHLRHRVEWTDAEGDTIWLAVHFEASERETTSRAVRQ